MTFWSKKVTPSAAEGQFNESQKIKFYDKDLLSSMTAQMNDPFVMPDIRETPQIVHGITLPGETWEWHENCVTCHVPMKTAVVDNNARLEAVVVDQVLPIDKKTWPKVYKDWLVEKPINPNQSFWVCPGCEGIWTVAGSFWARVKVNGEERLPIQSLNLTEVKVMSVKEKAGEAPSPESTLCPNCGVWREIKAYTEEEIQHICPRCRCADAYPVKSDAHPVKQGEK